MPASFEIWSHPANDSFSMWASPNPRRIFEISDPSSMLLLRFSAAGIDQAKVVYERLLFEGNPDNLATLKIPATEFYLHEYPCGLSVGKRLTLKGDYPLLLEDYPVGFFAKGTVVSVRTGDREFPDLIAVDVTTFPKDRIGKVSKFQIPAAELDEFFAKTE